MPLNNAQAIQLIAAKPPLASWPNLRGAGTVFEHQAAFVGALRAGHKMRKRIFDTIEQRHAYDLGNGREGKRLYEVLLSAVRDSGVPEAAEEFENRFFPLLNADRRRGEAHTSSPEEMINRDRVTSVQDRQLGGWAWVSAVCVAGVLCALILGLNAFKMTAAEGPTVTEAPIPAKATEPTSETIAEPLPATVAEAPIPDAKATEPASETTTEPVSAIAEQELSPEH